MFPLFELKRKKINKQQKFMKEKLHPVRPD